MSFQTMHKIEQQSCYCEVVGILKHTDFLLHKQRYNSIFLNFNRRSNLAGIVVIQTCLADVAIL